MGRVDWGEEGTPEKSLRLRTKDVSPPSRLHSKPGLRSSSGRGKQVKALWLPEQRRNASGIKQSLFIFKLPAQDFQKSFPKRLGVCVHKKLYTGV